MASHRFLVCVFKNTAKHILVKVQFWLLHASKNMHADFVFLLVFECTGMSLILVQQPTRFVSPISLGNIGYLIICCNCKTW